MKKNKKNTKKNRSYYICFCVASICFYIVALMKFIHGDSSAAVVFLCLGSTFFCLFSRYLQKSDDDKKEE